jgi:hypothetical protein
LITPIGSAAGIAVTVADGVLNVVKNDNIDNNLIVV